MNVAIIGNGIAGITVATELRKHDKSLAITVISGESEFLYSRPALMYIYMRDMKLKDTQPYEKKFWKKQKINLVQAWVEEIDYEEKRLNLQGHAPISYDKLVLALGSKGNKFGWPGQDLADVQCFTSLQELELLEQRTAKMGRDNRVAIVGGGLIGIEVAEMMFQRKLPCSFVVREDTYWDLALSAEEGRMVEEEIRDHAIDLHMGTNLTRINADGADKVVSIDTDKTNTIDCDLVLLTAGVSPNLNLVKDTQLKTERGIVVNPNLETNIKDVYACGDCAQINRKNQRPQIEALWYTGIMHGKVVAKNILGGNEKYDRGIWYNSAKFFSIDYHTYGFVGHDLPDEKDLYYRVPNQRKSIRITYQPDKVIGFNILGIRYRDNVCRKWIAEERSLDYVIAHLQEANFDGEFHDRFEGFVKTEYRGGILV